MIPVGIIAIMIGNAPVPPGWEDASSMPEARKICENLIGGSSDFWDFGDRWYKIEIKCIIKVYDQ
jgi:hypothetical protein